MAARGDENSISFYKKDLENFIAVRSFIENKIVERSKPQVITVVSQGTSDLADQIKKLADLRDSGILSEEEFQTQKNKLLS